MLWGTDRRGNIKVTDAGWKSYSSFIKMQSPDDGRKSGLFIEGYRNAADVPCV